MNSNQPQPAVAFVRSWQRRGWGASGPFVRLTVTDSKLVFKTRFGLSLLLRGEVVSRQEIVSVSYYPRLFIFGGVRITTRQGVRHDFSTMDNEGLLTQSS